MAEIKKGDRLILTLHGMEVVAVAASAVSDGTLQIKYKGAISTIGVSDVRLADADAVHTTGIQPDVTQGHPPCKTCGQSGEWQSPNIADGDRRVLISTFRCPNGHEWREETPLG